MPLVGRFVLQQNYDTHLLYLGLNTVNSVTQDRESVERCFGKVPYTLYAIPNFEYPRPNLRNIVNYRINIAQHRTISRNISRTRQPSGAQAQGPRAAKRPLINTPIKTAALRLWERLRERLISLESCDARAQFWARTMNLCGRHCGVAKGADARKIGQNRQIRRYRQISPDIARYRQISRIIA